MKKIFIFILVFLLLLNIVGNVSAETPTVTPGGPRYAVCDLCGYCQLNPAPTPNPVPQSWSACQQCLYPNIAHPDNPNAMDTLIVDPTSNLPPTGVPGKQYTFLGCLGGSGGFTNEGTAGEVVQSLLNIIFSISGGIAFLYLLYGSFILATSQANPEKLNYGKRVIYGAIAGLLFILGSVFIVRFIASGILKIPGFGE